MRYASISYLGENLVGALDRDDYAIVDDVTELDRDAIARIFRDDVSVSDRRIPVRDVRHRPLIPQPAKIICVGLNYASHIEECAQLTPEYPVLFTKFATSLVGADETISLPAESSRVDYEGELAVVIGAPTRRVTAVEAIQRIAGYTIANDVSMRDYQFKTHQWLPGKAWDQSTPLGPVLVTPDEIPDVQHLHLTTRVNSDTRQSSSLELMLLPVGELIARISEFTTLEPGDVILTGTPSGVGDRRDPPSYIHPGDTVDITITHIGTLRNEFTAETDADL